mgnify:CR=1 FL=1
MENVHGRFKEILLDVVAGGVVGILVGIVVGVFVLGLDTLPEGSKLISAVDLNARPGMLGSNETTGGVRFKEGKRLASPTHS